MENETLVVIDDLGNEIVCEIIFTFESEDYDRSYVVYRPLESEEDVYAASYSEEDGLTGSLTAVEDAEEWEMVEEVLATFMEE